MSDIPQSKSQKLLEIGKCIKDPVYAIENFLETFDQTQKSFVRFKLFPIAKFLNEPLFNYMEAKRSSDYPIAHFS